MGVLNSFNTFSQFPKFIISLTRFAQKVGVFNSPPQFTSIQSIPSISPVRTEVRDAQQQAVALPGNEIT